MTTLANSYQNEIKKLRDRNDFLEEENRQLRLGSSSEIVLFRIPDTHLTLREFQMLSAIAQNEVATKPTVYRHLYPTERADGGPDYKLMDVYICKLRSKLKPHGIAIKAIWGRGWALDPDDRKKLLQWAVFANSPIGMAAA